MLPKRKRDGSSVKNGEQRTKTALILMGALAAIWFGLLVAPFVLGGLPEIIAGFPRAMETPFKILVFVHKNFIIFSFLKISFKTL